MYDSVYSYHYIILLCSTPSSSSSSSLSLSFHFQWQNSDGFTGEITFLKFYTGGMTALEVAAAYAANIPFEECFWDFRDVRFPRASITPFRRTATHPSNACSSTSRRFLSLSLPPSLPFASLSLYSFFSISLLPSLPTSTSSRIHTLPHTRYLTNVA